MDHMKHIGIFMATLFLPLFAWTQFDRIDVEEVDNGGTVSGKTFRIYAVMQNEGDVIDAVFGEDGKPLEISSTAPFYQHPKGSGLASEVQRFDMQNDAALAFDSWVTIGLDGPVGGGTGESGVSLLEGNDPWIAPFENGECMTLPKFLKETIHTLPKSRSKDPLLANIDRD